MANYLPVLLVSVSTNAVPDDSSLSTQPRGQVDYLSHNWQEEDVWKSWRNMTRQKNEIANGVRLENASWRTWWKQRNKLKTVSPEALNWLKDSDVTWLYGPLHTAVDWTPPPQPKPPPSSVDDKPCPTSAHDRLDLSIPDRAPPKTKPILKHRSISELLLSDLPLSPGFSPTESEEEEDHYEQSGEHESDATQKPIRPTLMHTKSDTYISRWGPTRAFRKDSPPRIDPPGHNSNNPEETSDSASNSARKASPNAQQPTKRKHILFNTYVEQCIAIEKPRKAGVRFGDPGGWDVRGPGSQWQYDDGYEEDEGESDDELDDCTRSGSTRISRASHTRYPVEEAVVTDSDSYDGNYDNGVFEDEDNDNDDDDDEEEEEVVEEEEEGGLVEDERDQHIEIRPGKRSQSTYSTASSSSSSATTTSESPSNSPRRKARRRGAVRPPPRQRRGSVYATYSPKTHTVSTPANVTTSDEPLDSSRTTSPSLKHHSGARRSSHSNEHTYHHHHVTIAPIAPTILKTSAGEEGEQDIEFGSLASTYGFMYGFGDEDQGKGYGPQAAVPPFGWRDGFGDDGGDAGSDDGMSALPGAAQQHWDTKHSHTARRRASTGGDEVRPVDLVYVPSVGNQYGLRLARNHPGPGRQLGPPHPRHQPSHLSIEDAHRRPEGHPLRNESPDIVNASIPILNVRLPPSPESLSSDYIVTPTSVPVVVEPSDIVTEPLDYPGSDTLEEFHRGRSNSRYLSGGVGSSEDSYRAGSKRRSSGDRLSRSRSRSHSRTPSPAFLASTTTNIQEVVGAIPIPKRRTDSASPPTGPIPASAPSSSSSLLSPPRGRGSCMQGDALQRGRSATRTTPSPTMMEERSRSRSSHGSPMGSLSPDSGITGGSTSLYGVSAGSRGSSRSEGQRRGERGRETTRKRIAQGSSSIPSSTIVPSSERKGTTGTSGAVIRAAEIAAVGIPTQSDSNIISTQGNTMSSSLVVVVPSQTISSPAVTLSIPVTRDNGSQQMLSDCEAQQRYTHPTPANSPVTTTSMTRTHAPQYPDKSEPTNTVQLRENLPPLKSTTSSSKVLSSPSPSKTSSAVGQGIIPPAPSSAATPVNASNVSHSTPVPHPPRSPLTVAPPHPAGPSTSYDTSVPSKESNNPPTHRTSRSPTSPTRSLASIVGSRFIGSPIKSPPPYPRSDAEDTPASSTGIVGKAVGIVSSAGAYLGFWHPSHAVPDNVRGESNGSSG